MLDLWRLRILETIESLGTMTAASQALSLTASAVSQQMAILEREAGVSLLQRTGRRVTLTDAGRELAERARGILSDVEAAEAAMNRRRVDITGVVRLAAFPTFAAAFLPRALTRLGATFPGLHVEVRDLEPHDALKELRSGRMDLGLIDNLTPGHDELPGMSVQLLYVDPLQMCLPLSYRDCPTDAIRLEDLKDEAWILDGVGTTFSSYVLEMCRAAGFEPKVAAYCSSPLVACALVAAGRGVALMPDLMVGHHVMPEGTVVLPLSAAPVRRIFTVYRDSRSASPEIDAVLKVLRATIRDVQRDTLER